MMERNRPIAGLYCALENNSEKNSEIFEFDGEIAEFCPKYANLISGTGDNSEITVNLRAGPA
jgi:hypothetical protein